MGIKNDIQKDLAEAFDNDLADAVSNFVLTHFDRDQGSYDTSNGTYTPVSADHNSRGVFKSYKQSELENSNIERTDMKLIVLQNEIDVEPRLKDTLVKENSKSFRVIHVGRDAAEATYQIQIRSVQS